MSLALWEFFWEWALSAVIEQLSADLSDSTEADPQDVGDIEAGAPDAPVIVSDVLDADAGPEATESPEAAVEPGVDIVADDLSAIDLEFPELELPGEPETDFWFDPSPIEDVPPGFVDDQEFQAVTHEETQVDPAADVQDLIEAPEDAPLVVGGRRKGGGGKRKPEPEPPLRRGVIVQAYARGEIAIEPARAPALNAGRPSGQMVAETGSIEADLTLLAPFVSIPDIPVEVAKTLDDDELLALLIEFMEL